MVECNGCVSVKKMLVQTLSSRGNKAMQLLFNEIRVKAILRLENIYSYLVQCQDYQNDFKE